MSHGMIITIEQTEHPDHIMPVMENNDLTGDGTGREEAIKAEYEEREKSLQERILALEYDKRELEFKLSISNEDRVKMAKEKTAVQGELNALREEFEELGKVKEEVNDLRARIISQVTKHEEEINRRVVEYKTLSEGYKKLKKNYALETGEKKELEEVVFQQESRVQELQSAIKHLEHSLNDKENVIKETQFNIEQLKNIIDGQKKTIASMQKRAKIINTTPIPSNEFLSLQNQLKAMKKDNEQKDAKISLLQMNNRILNTKMSKALPLTSLRSANEMQNDHDRAVSAIAETKKKKRLDNPKPKAKDKPQPQPQPIVKPSNVNPYTKQYFDFYESDPVYCEPSLSLNFNGTMNTHNNNNNNNVDIDVDIDNFLKKPMNDYKVLQPLLFDKGKDKDTPGGGVINTIQSQVEFPIIESYSVLKSQSEIYDRDDSKVEEIQVMVKRILNDF